MAWVKVRSFNPPSLGGRRSVTGGKASPSHQAWGFSQPFHGALPTKPVALRHDLKIAAPLRFREEGSRRGPPCAIGACIFRTLYQDPALPLCILLAKRWRHDYH